MPVAFKVNSTRYNCECSRDPDEYRYNDVIYSVFEGAWEAKAEIIAKAEPEDYRYDSYHSESCFEFAPYSGCHNYTAVCCEQTKT